MYRDQIQRLLDAMQSGPLDDYPFELLIDQFAFDRNGERRSVDASLGWVFRLYAQQMQNNLAAERQRSWYGAEVLDAMPRGLRGVATTDKCIAEIMNGGLTQLFMNVREDAFYEWLFEDLAWIDAAQMTEWMRQAVEARAEVPGLGDRPRGEIFAFKSHPTLQTLTQTIYADYGRKTPMLEAGWIARLRETPDLFIEAR